MWPLVRGLIACFLECVWGFEVSESTRVCVWKLADVNSKRVSGCGCTAMYTFALSQSLHIMLWECLLIALFACCSCAWICVCMCVRVACTPSQTPFWTPFRPPPPPPTCDELSWMLMFCDGCGANKCFWHSTGSHYRSRPNGLARALMSRQVSQPQQLYRSHTLLMQGQTSAPLDQNLE